MNSFPINPSNHLSSIPDTIIEQMGTQKFSLQSDGNVVADHNSTVHSRHQRSMFSRNPGFLIVSIILLLIVGGSFFALFQGMQSSKLPGALTQTQAPLSLATSINHPTQNSSTGIYVAMDTYLYKLDKNGKTKLWEHDIKGLGNNIVVINNVVYAYSVLSEASSSYVYAFRATNGQLLWKVQMVDYGVQGGSNLVADNQNVYVFSAGGNVYALNGANGKQRWMYPTHAFYINNFAQMNVANDVLYISNGHQFSALHTANGHLFWMKNSGVSDGMFFASHIANGIVYVPLSKEMMPGANPSVSTIYAWTTSGNLRWHSQQINDFVSDAPTIGGNQLYVAGVNNIFAINSANGKISWQSFVGTTNSQKPLFDHDTLYMALEGPYRWTLAKGPNKTQMVSVIALKVHGGSLIWQKQYKLNVPSVRAIVNGVLYVDQGYNGHVYAISIANHAPLWSFIHPIPDPMHPQGTGNTLVVIP